MYPTNYSLANHIHGLVVRVFANGPGDLGSIPGRVIPKTQKMVLDTSLLNTQHYKVRIKGQVEPSREGVAPSPTSWCSSYRKGSLRVTLDYGRQLYFTYTIALLLTKPLLDDDSGFRHGFGAEASLPLAQNAPAVSHNTTRLCQIVVALWDCQIHANAVSALSYIYDENKWKSG